MGKAPQTPEVVVPSTGGRRWWEKAAASLKQGAVAQPFKTTWTGGKIELAGMGGRSGEDLKGTLVIDSTVSFLWVWERNISEFCLTF